MMRRKKLWILATVTTAVAFSLWVWRQHSKATEPTVETVRRQLEHALPVGSSGTAVDNYLDSQAILHEHINDSSNEFALMRGNGLLVRRDIQIRFHFDRSGRLLDYSLKEVFTGP